MNTIRSASYLFGNGPWALRTYEREEFETLAIYSFLILTVL
jgi:hypothetical protein